MARSRRSFLRLLCTLPLVGAGGIDRSGHPDSVVLEEFPVAGLRYYAGSRLLRTMRSGDAVEIAAEPENAHDPFAVRIAYRGRRIGYVPRQRNRAIATLLAQCARVEGVISTVDADAAPWEAVRVRLTLAPAARDGR
ncbi:MAG: HIRAN domain-containing protein [Gemmatimonadota bacterium]